MSTSYYLVCLACRKREKERADAAAGKIDANAFKYDVNRLAPHLAYELVDTTPILVDLHATGRWDLATLEESDGTTRRPAAFLVAHEKCELTVFDEYGRQHFEDGIVGELPRD